MASITNQIDPSQPRQPTVDPCSRSLSIPSTNTTAISSLSLKKMLTSRACGTRHFAINVCFKLSPSTHFQSSLSSKPSFLKVLVTRCVHASTRLCKSARRNLKIKYFTLPSRNNRTLVSQLKKGLSLESSLK